MSSVISIKSLSKTYNQAASIQRKMALHGLDLDIPAGCIFGLLGANGAGKSTLINILAGTVLKTAGSVSILGHDIDTHPKLARSQIGIVPQEVVIDSFFPLGVALEFTAGYYGIRPGQRKTDEILKTLSLYDKKHSLPRELSGGMKRRYLIAKAMVHSPKILVLDEPTAGVDIELREQLWSYAKRLKDSGVTVIITTHYLEEAEELCDEIAFINHGEIVKRDTKDNLLQNLGKKYVEFEFYDPILKEQLVISDNMEVVQMSDNTIRFYMEARSDSLTSIIDIVRAVNAPIRNLQVAQTDLESIFKQLIYTNT